MSYKGYQFVNDEKPEKPIYPARVQTLIEAYVAAGKKVDKKINLRYEIETIDLHEKIFDDRARQKPESLKVTINAVYRVKSKEAEFYYYAATKTCNNALNQPAEPFSYEQYGYFKKPVVTLRWDEAAGKNFPSVTSYTHGWELKWDKVEVKKLLDSSYLPCELFYVGNAGISANDPIEDRHYQIQNKTDFLEGSFEDLMDMGRLGISYKEQESLYMVEAARKREKENRERALGMRQPQNQHIT
jgi:hypothetical protein